ncbi:MAG: c-type cytochrome domain-containing protein, partial [Opitutaceae bacterium]
MTATAFSRRFARACALLVATASAAAADEAGIEFLEKKIRPVLIERCHECHAADKKVKAGLRLDHAEGWLRGGDSGPAVIPGKPDESP